MKNEKQVEIVRKQLLMNISEILAQQGLLTDEEKNRMKIIIGTK